ncbi:hypothetical protein [Streptomyces profundus]|uniref:hypothetical protein n=1 Tax=Streptomyces profundus TaxID=2867410 RepID=UPI001D16F024|nr:hypothetical protein [Streptomyces sp. MA3_2.13]UED84509.1 hypothetical protein K4G22_10085 [Streptomyces sp. MA3_2.13]
MSEHVPERASCVPGAGAAGQILPVPVVVVVVVVLFLTAGLVASGMAVELVVAVVATGGLLARELIGGLLSVLTRHEA